MTQRSEHAIAIGSNGPSNGTWNRTKSMTACTLIEGPAGSDSSGHRNRNSDMGTTAHQTQRLLHSNHLDDLRGSGLSLETIERSGCYSITDPQGMHDAGFGHFKPPALALPIAPP